MRKVNFAAVVKQKTPHDDAVTWPLLPNYRNNNGQWMFKMCWTGFHICGIIIYTH